MQNRPAPGADQATEVARIQANYRERDASGVEDRYRFIHARYAFYMQLTEWSLLQALRRFAGDISSASALDVGCGTGYFAHRLLEFGVSSATGVDLMEDRVRGAEERYPTVHFQQANAAKLPFDDGSFEIVTQFVCFSSVIDPALRSAIASEMWRVTRPGGIVLSYDMRPEPLPLRIRRWRRLRRARREGRPTAPLTPTVAISRQELKRLFPEASLWYSSIGLDFELCVFAERSYLAARLLAGVPALRAHALAVMRKQDQAV
jgi:ubiquinone/menaquinone biosynthesis C-methylase UbiE